MVTYPFPDVQYHPCNFRFLTMTVINNILHCWSYILVHTSKTKGIIQVVTSCVIPEKSENKYYSTIYF
jgi:hypothetical protein